MLRDGESWLKLLIKQKKELIKEFLKGFRWGKAFEIHWKSRNFWVSCKCKNNPSMFWEWFEKKWEDAIEPK